MAELQSMTLHEPFSFTKGCQVMKIKSQDKYKAGRFGTLLFDIEKDPGQQHPLNDAQTEQRFVQALITEMEKNDSPDEQYERLGLNPKP